MQKKQSQPKEDIKEMCNRLGLRLWPTWTQHVDRLLPAIREYDKTREAGVLFMLPIGFKEIG